ncbi:hypothetical protein Pmani_014934 [Petrolisthes manimaculis]|uniref:Uncharacterized protein n=1 Tax=Petrolisthes manimaculis TaxID=1843537 RepID=A0AAE1U870_9EUCA|nr:hypothetical protein Pmani_014934 [Petrolisthes manimaculis]
MDERWEEDVKEYGAVNITGLRIVDTSRPYVKDFLRTWSTLDPNHFPGAGSGRISNRRVLPVNALRRMRKVLRACEQCTQCNAIAKELQARNTKFVREAGRLGTGIGGGEKRVMKQKGNWMGRKREEGVLKQKGDWRGRGMVKV